MNEQNLSFEQIQNFVRKPWQHLDKKFSKLPPSPKPYNVPSQSATDDTAIFCTNSSPFSPASALRSASLQNPLIPHLFLPAFTLIELMAATTVLSVILLMMVGMQDQMSKAWSNANRRTDATREARAAAILMAGDLSFPIFRGQTNYSADDYHNHDEMAYSATNKPLPFLYSSNGANLGISIANLQSGSSCLFFVATQRPSKTNNSDLGLVGYYVAQDTAINANGFSVTNYNLYRYYSPASNAAANLRNWFATNGTIADLFPNVSPQTDDILARNVANLTITFYNENNPMVNGLNYTNTTGGINNIYRANKMQVSLTLYPDDVAQKLTSLADWVNPKNIQSFSRSFEFRVDCARD